MPLVKSCNPADHGRTFNTTLLIQNDVEIEVRWNWDGVSAYPACDGPLVNGTGQGNNWAVRVVNPTGFTWYAHTTRKNGLPATYSLGPQSTAMLTANQMNNAGYQVASDFNDLTLSMTP